MNSQVSCLAWRQLLPEGVAVSAGPHLENPMPLTDAERLSAGDIGVERRRELENGRTYAKQALTLLGFRDVEIPVAADRSPVWPEGIVGSITHVTGGACGHFAAAVARIRDVNAIGIDIERETGIHPRLWDYFLTQGRVQAHSCVSCACASSRSAGRLVRKGSRDQSCWTTRPADRD